MQHYLCILVSMTLTTRIQYYFSNRPVTFKMCQSQRNWYEQVKLAWGYRHAEFQASHIWESTNITVLCQGRYVMWIISLNCGLKPLYMFMHYYTNHTKCKLGWIRTCCESLIFPVPLVLPWFWSRTLCKLYKLSTMVVFIMQSLKDLFVSLLNV